MRDDRLSRGSPSTLLLAGLLLCLPGTLPDSPRSVLWGATGHRIVARLAYGLLTPTARKAVNGLIKDQGIAAIATWADEIRNSRPKTRPLHFVDIPLSAEAFDSARDCKAGNCVVWAVKHYRDILADPTASKANRVEALKFLVHFMGDLHQPLHCADKGDRGGNDFPVTFFGKTNNLHSVWDSGLIDEAGMSENHYVSSLHSRLAQADTAALALGTVEDWANESHKLAAEYAYDSLQHHGKLETKYFDQTIDVVEQQLIKAAVRLARVLNEALG